MSDEQGVIRRRGQSTSLNFTVTAFRTVGMGFTLYYFGDD